MKPEPSIDFALFDTPLGRCAAAWSECGLVRVQLPEADDERTRARVLSSHPRAREGTPTGAVARALDDIAALLAGERRTLHHVALDLRGVPPFHIEVYEALRQVGPGKTVGYGELAKRIGSPAASRAVGQAVGRNPFALVVPCHRVLAVGGRAGGFSAYGGVETKRRLLALEGVAFRTAQRRAAPIKKPVSGSPLPFDPAHAVAHLKACDARLARLIDRWGPLDLRLERAQSTFDALVRSIVHQQLTGKAAATIHARLCSLFERRRPRPEAMARLSDEALRGAGLSRSKIIALRDIAQGALDGRVPALRVLGTMSDEEIVARLLPLRGVGRWTAEMLLIFRLGRPDVLPVADYGVRHGFKLAYGKRALPTPSELARHGERWRPFRTVASWYLWRAVDLERQAKGGTGPGE